MSVLITYELKLLLLGLAAGAGLMATYDVFRIFRIFIPHGSLWTGIEDLVYWIYAAMITYLLLYRYNDGVVRSFVVGASFVGMIVYDRLLSRFLLQFLENVCNLLKKKVKWITMKISRHKKHGTDKAGEWDGK